MRCYGAIKSFQHHKSTLRPLYAGWEREFSGSDIASVIADIPVNPLPDGQQCV
jgi:hypothetical protein